MPDNLPDNLIIQSDPVRDIAKESLGLIQRYKDHPLKKERNQILAYYDDVLELADATRDLFDQDRLCIVNTEVNSGNFLISDQGAFLVDWEKAVVSFRYQDLGHFLVPTTTLWKTDTCLTKEEKTRFLSIYRTRAGLDLDLSQIRQATTVLEKTILLRALSWCFMAFYEYTQTDRPLQNPDTFKKNQAVPG